jgi:hypothetical protein
MFKRLFISLLLLSSLSTEGMANLPYEVYSLYFGTVFSDTSFSAATTNIRYDKASEKVVRLEKASTRSLLAENKLYVMKGQLTAIVATCRDTKYFYHAYTISSAVSCSKWPADLLNKSDLSPPAALV